MLIHVPQDGMDQNKTSIPHPNCNPKKIQHLKGLPVHVMGALAHGRTPGAYSLQSLRQFPGDPNFTIECLRRVLLDMETRSAHRPQHLHLVMDNCVKENKNKYLLSFLGALVHRRCFKEVTQLVRKVRKADTAVH